MGDAESKEVAAVKDVADPQASFEESMRSDPMGDRLLDRVELFIFVLGITSSLLTLLVGNLSVTLGWAVGWLVGQGSVGMSRRLTRRLISSQTGSKVSAVLLVLKTFFLLIGVWVTLTWTNGDVIAFAGGYGLTLTGLVLGSVLCAPRQPTGESSQGAPMTLDNDEKRG